ncbi:porin [Pararobbsia silviterrae]|uniref:Porin n=1 Tax=Pararobbsia silviterrae TaxID=1792498 RepID=A0A494XMM5_9BURK|nr:porin [Pararobbsia silviterrae]RKP51940.1 porin [Pararobbsia silviterrae]
MKYKLIAAACLAGVASLAQAQNSVTLYGALDTSLAYFSNQKGTDGQSGRTFEMMSGNMSPNNFGLKGNEDLGGGLSAIFKLESGFNIDNGKQGQGGRLFGRQAWVGLDSTQYGSVTLGRQYDPLIDLIQPLTNDGAFGSTFATPGDMDNYDNSYRTDNSVKYTSPNLSGLQMSAMYAFGGQAGATGSGQTYAIAAAYNNGPFGFGAGYFHANSNGTSGTFDGLNPNASFANDSDAITGGFVTANSLQIIRAAGDYVFGPFTVGIAYSNVEYDNYAGPSASDNNTHFNTGQFFMNYQLTPAALLGVGYNYTKGDGNGVDAIYNQVSLGADYFLSKRTDLYALAGYQHASGQTISGETGEIVAATASFADFGNDSSSNSQKMFMVGIRHHF